MTVFFIAPSPMSSAIPAHGARRGHTEAAILSSNACSIQREFRLTSAIAYG